MMATTQLVHISAYKFITLTGLPELRIALKEQCLALDLKGTILLSTEGINLMLAGQAQAVATMQAYLREDPNFADLVFKPSLVQFVPFKRMLVKIKHEAVTMRVPHIRPDQKTAPHIAPQQLKAWLDQQQDFLLLDTRNRYEVVAGTFRQAVDLGIDHFREFPAAVKKLPEAQKQKPVVMFCTGGIRCEKAALLLQEYGFAEVYQLDGGILNYFKTCGDAHYQGSCFVFDEREVTTPEELL